MSKARDLASAAPAPSTVSATELGYLDGVTSAIQTQINTKASTSYVDTAVAGVDLTNVQRIVPVDSNISVPGAPTSVSASSGNAQATVSFVAPTSNGGSTILSYTVISSPGNIKKSGSSSPITITGLTNGTAYTFTVKAHNIAGSSVASSASGSITPLAPISVDYLVVAGGGGSEGDRGAGGGAGGLRSTVTATGGGGSVESALTLDPGTNYTVTVGAGGSSGSNSVFSTITSAGGGKGGYYTGSTIAASSGGSGGGGAGVAGPTSGGAGTANQGYAGGQGVDVGAGGGGGAGAVGGNGTSTSGGTGGVGGAGVAVSITGSSVTYAGGGGGYGTNGSAGGAGGGGQGSTPSVGYNAANGTANTGGGAGGTHGSGVTRSGGSGVVILRWLTSAGSITVGAGLTADATGTDGSYSYKKFTAGTGNISFS